MEEFKKNIHIHTNNESITNEIISTTTIKTEPNITPGEKLEYCKDVKQPLVFSECTFTQDLTKFINHEAGTSTLNAMSVNKMNSYQDEEQTWTFIGTCDPSGSKPIKLDADSREPNALLKDEMDCFKKTEYNGALCENGHFDKHIKSKINKSEASTSQKTKKDCCHDVKEISSSAGKLYSQNKRMVLRTSDVSNEPNVVLECNVYSCQNVVGSDFNSKKNSIVLESETDKSEPTMTSEDTTLFCPRVTQSSNNGFLKQNKCVRLISECGSLSAVKPFFKPHKCDICELRFKKPSDLKRHLQVHSNKKPFQCGQCELSFTRSSGLQKHLRTHSGEKPFMCIECAASFKQSSHMKMHMRSHTGEKPYKCDECCMAFASSSDLKCHLRIHKGIRPYTCSTCGAVFTTSSGLNRHLKIHTGDKPFKCNMCEMSFIGSSILRYHLRSHTGEKPFLCSMCEMSFSYSASLKRHMRVHTGEKPYKCDIGCNATFTCLSSLKVHRRSHTGERPFKCDKCEMSCIDSSNLKKHYLRTHKSL